MSDVVAGPLTSDLASARNLSQQPHEAAAVGFGHDASVCNGGEGKAGFEEDESVCDRGEGKVGTDSQWGNLWSCSRGFRGEPCLTVQRGLSAIRGCVWRVLCR
jgi:hypothetical protein